MTALAATTLAPMQSEAALIAIPEATIINADTTWVNSNEYFLQGRVFVEGATLTIEPGTLIRGQSPTDPLGTGQPGALIISRTGKIDAQGTPTQPIVFTGGEIVSTSPLTVAGDDHFVGPAPAAGTSPWTDRNNLETGLWGGVVVLGQTYIASNDFSPTQSPNGAIDRQIEGLTAFGSLSRYGGADDNDDSGIMEYVSIRYGGFVLGLSDEINGLTMGAVGDATDIKQIEVYQNSDDGYEWFGGTVNTKFLTTINVGDDGFDWDEGFRGKGQFWLTVQGTTNDGTADKAGELDGADGDSSQPSAIPTVYNWTAIGLAGNTTRTNNLAVHLRDGTGGRIYNSVFANFAGLPVMIEGAAGGGYDSADNLYTQDDLEAIYLGTNLNGGGALPSFPAPFTQVANPGLNWNGFNHTVSQTMAYRQLGVTPSTGGIVGLRGTQEGRLEIANTCFENFLTIQAFGQTGPEALAEEYGASGGSDDTKPHLGSFPVNTGYTLADAALSGVPNGNYPTGPAALLPSIFAGPRATTTAGGVVVTDTVDLSLNRAGYTGLLGFDSVATTGRVPPLDDFFTPVSFYGAFLDRNWQPWTVASKKGYFVGLPDMTPAQIDALETGIRCEIFQVGTTWRVRLTVPDDYAGFQAQLFVGGLSGANAFYWLGTGINALTHWALTTPPTPPSIAPFPLTAGITEFDVLDTTTSPFPGSYPLTWAAIDLVSVTGAAYDSDYAHISALPAALTVP